MRKLSFLVAKPLCLLLVLSFALFDLSVKQANAGIIGAETIFNTQVAQADRIQVVAFLEREDVRQAMMKQGVDPEEVKNRVAALTDAEVRQIANEIDNLPAGADLGSVVGAAVFIFVVLLITDILGFTKIFSFTRPIAR